MVTKKIKLDRLRFDGVVEDMAVAAEVAFKNQSGKFVYITSENLDLAIDTTQEIFGWAIVGEMTASATAGDTKISVDTNREHIFEIPSDTVFTAATLKAAIGDVCDLAALDSGVQKVAFATTPSHNVLQIVGGDVDRQILYVKMTPKEFGQTAVA